MEPVDIVRGRMAPLGRDDVDTDQIMPKEHLKRIDRTGYGPLIFDHWRRDPSFVLNDPAHADANVLLTGANFGCGSSREHAPWGLQQAGFDAIVASSFADIFRANCTNIGLLTVAVDPKVLRTLLRIAAEDPEAVVEIDLPSRRARIDHAVDAPFAIDDLSAQRLLEGRDRVTDTLERLAAIEAFEERREEWLPVTD